MSTQVAYFEEWRDLMRSWGFTVLEAAGWRTRDAEPGSTYLPGMLYIEHHDASTKLSGNWGALAYILANKLANIVTARDGQIMLCAAGVAWHAGVGGPMFDVPANGANPRSLGNEVCNSGSEAYDPRCTRAIIAGEKAWAIVSGRTAERVRGHKEWATPPGRKTDPSIDMYQRRRDVAAFASSGTGDSFMPNLTEAEQREILTFTREQRMGVPGVHPAGPAGMLHHRVEAIVKSIEAQAIALAKKGGVDAVSIAEALKPLLLEAVREGMSADNEDQADAIVDRLIARLAT